ncbi:exocyst complex component 3-like protein isoform 3-T3 [Morphnus guianensis]
MGFRGVLPPRETGGARAVPEPRDAEEQLHPVPAEVHEVFSHTLQLLSGQQLLEAHAELMMMEHLRDDILSQLHLRGLSSAQATVLSYFGGLRELNESLAKQLWDIVGSSLRLVREDPVLFVTAVRIIEREEKIDDTLLLEATFLPPGRPKGWRQKFYHVLQETITGAHFHAVCMDTEGPELARHLAALQKDIVSELRVVKDLMVQCVPAHYNILSVCTVTYHQALTSHLQDILREDLDKQALFLLLEWALRVYHSPEMMGHPDLLPEVDVSALGPLMSPELVDQTERKYVVKVKASVLEWMQRTLEVEFKEWFREEEPETDHQGFFQSALPVIVMQMLNENIRVASLITDSLQQKVYNMALEELEAFLGRLREALVQCGKEHQKDRTIPKYYVSYLLAMLNNNLALSSSVSFLHPDTARREVPMSLQAALDRMQKKACQLLLEELLLDLQPLCLQLPSRKWLSGSQLVSSMCEVIDKYAKNFSRVRKPVFMLLLTESELLVTSQYLRALMQKKMVCKSKEERGQLCDRLLQDATQLRELFCGLGLDQSQQSLEAVFALRELICLKDPALLSLEVLGFITKYPDVRFLHDGQHHPGHWLFLHASFAAVQPLVVSSLGAMRRSGAKPVTLPASLCPAPVAPWETCMLCHASCLLAGWILLSLPGTTARNKGLSSAITHQCPGSVPQWVRAGIRARGWHREGGIHPCAQHHPRNGSRHHPGTWGMMDTLRTPCVQDGENHTIPQHVPLG